MAVIVDFTVPGATHEQMYTVEELTRTRGEAAGRPPYDGRMFMALTADGSGFSRRVGVAHGGQLPHRARDHARARSRQRGLAAAQIRVTPALSMAIPGGHGP